MSLSIIEDASELVSQAIFLSGVARSGTTILGKAIHSMKGVEYAFEPPMLFSLMPLIDKLPHDEWKLLFETYLYEDFLINAVSGRSINCNKSDDSSIYKVKSHDDIENRLNTSISKIEAISIAKKMTIALKMPDMAYFFPTLKYLYPNMRMVVIRRDASNVINSLLHKKWFSNEVLNKGLVWPFDNSHSVCIPFWVKNHDYDCWLKMPEIDRCAYYYIRMNESFGDSFNYININYDELIDNPSLTIHNLANKLRLSYGDKTEEIINTIHRTESFRHNDILNLVSTKLREEMQLYLKV